MSITMYSGRPGAGKTYYAVHDMLKFLDKGYIVYSNIEIKWSGYKERVTWLKRLFFAFKLKRVWKNYPSSNLRYWKDLSDIYNVREGIIFMDEAHLYINSRRWKGMPIEMERKLAQHRKQGLHIVGTVQNVNRLDVIFRELIDYWYICNNFLGYIIATEFDHDEDRFHTKPLSSKFIKLTKRRFLNYDSYAEVELTSVEISRQSNIRS